LQQDLQTEIALAQNGFANNVSLKQKELAEAKKNQEKALALQAEAVKKQQQMETAMQLVTLITSTANIIKGATEIAPGPFAIPLAIASLAAMWGVFAAAKISAANATKMSEGGEIGGLKHSQGGTMIEAERGEFVVKASAYDKHSELVQAINNEDMSQVYRSLNRDLSMNTNPGISQQPMSVSLDDTNTAKMLGRHFSNKKQVEYFDGYRVETIGNRRRTIRHA
jgi:hypothetical protein